MTFREEHDVTSDSSNYEEGTTTHHLLKLGWKPLRDRRDATTIYLLNQGVNHLANIPTSNIPQPSRHSRHVHNKHFNVPFATTKGAFFYPKFWNENDQNVKCTRFSMLHSYSGMDRTPFQPFCSQGQNEQNVVNENPRWRTAR